MSKWKEIEINNPKGIDTTMAPAKESCTVCKNLDLRDNLGELVLSPAVTIKYAVPSFNAVANFTPESYIGMDTFYVTKTATRKEVTVLVMKGELAKVTGSTTTPASKNMLAVAIRPYWTGSAWTDAWRWLNESYLTDLLSISSYVITSTDFTQTIFNTQPHWVAHNVTKNQTANVLAVDGSNNITISINAASSGWANGNTILFMANYFPVAYMDEMYNTTKDEISFHKVIGEMRIGFGGYENRLGMSIKYLKTFGNVDTLAIGTATYKTQINNYDEIVLDPYNIIDGASTYLTGASLTGGHTPTNAGEGWIAGTDVGTKIYYVITAQLDGFQEYGVFSAGTSMLTPGTENTLKWQPIIKRATINKRLTNYKLYIAVTDKDNNDQIATKYKQVAYLTISQNVAKVYDVTDIELNWEIIANGDMQLTTPIEITKQLFKNSSVELNSTVGYTINKAEEDEYGIVTDYATSWDRAVVTQGRTFLLNPYFTARNVNQLFSSIISGSGAKMYDVIPAERVIPLEGRDGNDVLEILADQSMNIIASRPNSIEVINPVSGASKTIAPGVGGVSRRGMVHLGNAIIIPGEYEINGITGSSHNNISDPIRVAYKAISDKSLILGVRDEFRNCFRMYDGVGAEYIFVPGLGWTTATSTHTASAALIAYSVDEDGQVLMLKSDGNIYYRNNDAQIEGVPFEYKSIEYDISFLGEGIKATDRLLTRRFWIKYLSVSDDLTITFYFDGVEDTVNTLTALKNKTFANKELVITGAKKTFQFKIIGTKSTTLNDIRIKAFGFSMKNKSYGRWGTV